MPVAKTRRLLCSFGYPACPHREDQAGIWRLLRPEEIGVQLQRGIHDGSGGQRQRVGVPPSRLFSVGDNLEELRS